MMRVHATAQAARERKPAPTPYARTCLECGAPYSAARRHGDFCCPACRAAWNNRRKTRGAELYDLYMAMRYDRARAAALKVWRAMGRLAAYWRAEDQAHRGGRLSWTPPAEVLARRPWLRADLLQRKSKGSR